MSTEDITVKEMSEMIDFIKGLKYKASDNPSVPEMDKKTKLVDIFFMGKKSIIRTYSAGVWYGEVFEKDGDEVILKNATRLMDWKTKKSISLSAVAKYGVDDSGCRFAPPVDYIWLNQIEIIPCTEEAIILIEGVECA